MTTLHISNKRMTPDATETHNLMESVNIHGNAASWRYVVCQGLVRDKVVVTDGKAVALSVGDVVVLRSGWSDEEVEDILEDDEDTLEDD